MRAWCVIGQDARWRAKARKMTVMMPRMKVHKDIVTRLPRRVLICCAVFYGAAGRAVLSRVMRQCMALARLPPPDKRCYTPLRHLRRLLTRAALCLLRALWATYAWRKRPTRRQHTLHQSPALFKTARFTGVRSVGAVVVCAMRDDDLKDASSALRVFC